MNEPRWYNDHNVYIVGAGFSADAGIPTIARFFDIMRDAVPWLEENGREHEAQAIKKVIHFRLNATSAAYRISLDVENIEQLFSFASVIPDADLSQAIIRAIAGTIVFAEQTRHADRAIVNVDTAALAPPRAWRRLDRGPSIAPSTFRYEAPQHDVYASVMSGRFLPPARDPRSTIISLNYDCLLENSLSSMGIGFSYGIGTDAIESSVPGVAFGTYVGPRAPVLLKLHGSLNWAVGSTSSTIRVYRSYPALREAGAEALLIPPTWRKSLGLPLHRVWSSAIDALADATRIVFMGFSFPETDLHLRYLMAAGLQRNISLRQIFVVDQKADDRRWAARLRSVFSRQLLDSGMIRFRPGDVSDFLLTPEEQGSIDRRSDPTLRPIQARLVQKGRLVASDAEPSPLEET